MEIELLNETELKVTLTADDMERYEIDCAHMDYGTTETRRAFWSILDEARRKTGFDAARDRVYVRVYPCPDGGCDMYVTKLPEEKSEQPSKEDFHKTKELIPRTNTERPPHPRPVLYGLETTTADGLVELCALLLERGYTGESDAYVMKEASGDRFFLAVTETKPESGTISAAAILEEYGTRIASPAIRDTLSEHGRCIAAGNAVERLGTLKL